MVNFWSYVFHLPKQFYTKVDSLCAGFLWKNKTTSTVGARVSWINICKPKEEGGLGIRLLEDFEKVFRLKQVWILFTNAGSLWVAWVNANVFGRRSFWETEDANRFSRTIRSMLQIKHLLHRFMRCEVRDGNQALFWYDNWTHLGPLITFVGQNGPRSLRVSKCSSVASVVRDGGWWLPPARCAAAEEVQVALTAVAIPTNERGRDVFLWRSQSGAFVQDFSAKATWDHIREHSPTVPWHRAVWFKEAISRCSFIAWLTMLARLPTRDRLRRWGMDMPAQCVLCSTGLESHDHLFFECSFSGELWSFFSSGFGRNSPSSATDIAHWILTSRSISPPARSIVKLLLQLIIYHIWKERNRRIFSGVSSDVSSLRPQIDRTIRDRLLSYPAPSDRVASLLHLYFQGISQRL